LYQVWKKKLGGRNPEGVVFSRSMELKNLRKKTFQITNKTKADDNRNFFDDGGMGRND